MEKQIKLSELSSEELGLTLASFFEQGFLIQQKIHAIVAELKQRKDTNASNEGRN